MKLIPAFVLGLILAACGGTVDQSASAPLAAHASASCDGTCTTDADCGLGLGCATDGTCGIICGVGWNTICPSDTLCTATGDCLEPCRFAGGAVFYLDAVPACPAPFTERQTGQCFMTCGMEECGLYGGNACDPATESKAKARRAPAT